MGSVSSAPPLSASERARALFAQHLPCDNAVALRHVYLQLLMQLNPDKSSEGEATGMIQAIAEVYEELQALIQPRTQGSLQPNHGASCGPQACVKVAAQQGDAMQLRTMLQAFPEEANRPDEFGVYPVMFAAMVGSMAAVDVLLEFGANLLANNAASGSALLYAALQDNVAMTRDLVEKGAVVTGRDLCVTTWTGNANSLAVLLELYDGNLSDVRSPASGKTLLQLACEGLCVPQKAAQEHAECVQLVLSAGVPVEAVEPEKFQTCLHLYVGHCNWKRTLFDFSPSHMAVLEELCRCRADVNVEDADGRSPMSIVREAGLRRVEKVLRAHEGVHRPRPASKGDFRKFSLVTNVDVHTHHHSAERRMRLGC